MSVKKECVIVVGNWKCCRCLKGKKGCKFTVAEEEEKEEEGKLMMLEKRNCRSHGCWLLP